ncbi:cytochrome p450 [Moniliophthora roreri MCA 2997]|uniref:Cytochrome p450 n=2 Tax=Moniliophthora roreri TaxID=221103 RepID=V2WLF2_MONRO|nr:cytochrome p450 [Moniliophthora roreri MCA 2997]KAI3608541.1 cytochrome p450 [Moniliophthora roreri]
MSSILNLDWSPSTVVYTTLAGVFLYHFIPWLIDPYGCRQYPGPFLAQFTDAWLIWVAIGGHRSEKVHALHQKYGPIVRIAPNHLSIATSAALQTVYAHGNAALKSPFYDAFVAMTRGLFNTRDRAEHARKRKIVSHVFSQKSVVEFEPHVRLYVGQLLDQWERLCSKAVKGESGTEGEGGWIGKNGRLWLDCLPWCNYLAFDIIGDLAFGAPFGMLVACKDSAPVPVDQEACMNSYGKESEVTYKEIPAVKVINGRGEFSASLGVIPPYLRRLAKKMPWFRQGSEDVKTLSGIAIMAVAKRLKEGSDRSDLLKKLQSAKDECGNPMGRAELTAEALTLLIAGSDTTSNTTCAIIYYLATNPSTQKKLQQELDENLPAEHTATLESVKNLPYLQAVIQESLRLHSTSGIGLPRIVPEGGMTVPLRLGSDEPNLQLKEGSIVSVPSFTIHRDKEIWGDDFEAFRPERWIEAEDEWKDIQAKGGDDKSSKHRLFQQTFNPFSVGPRACVGKNLANLELQIIVASILRKFEFVMEDEGAVLKTSEGFLRKPLRCNVGIKKRDVL